MEKNKDYSEIDLLHEHACLQRLIDNSNLRKYGHRPSVLSSGILSLSEKAEIENKLQIVKAKLILLGVDI